MRQQAGALISQTIAAFPASRSSPHEQLSRLDFSVRLALALSAHSAINNPNFKIQLPTSPSLAKLRDGLKAIQRSSASAFAAIAQVGIELLAMRPSGPEPRLQTVEGLRNYLFHGGSLQSDVMAAQIGTEIASKIDQAAASIAGYLSDAWLLDVPDQSGPARVELQWAGTSYQLSPLLAFSTDSNVLLVFSRLTSATLTYMAARHESGQHLHRSADEPFLQRVFKQELADTFLSDLAAAARDDLDGFREPGSTISDLVENAFVLLNWHYADGGKIVLRHDTLRVGPDNVWQWKDGETWHGYSDFLRKLANWPILKQRLSSMLEASVTDARQREERLLPLPATRGSTLPFIAPMLMLGPMGGPQEKCSFEHFSDRLNRDVEANRGTTYLYFVHAEAGAGKTTALMRMALERARDEAVPFPLFLYVSARGNVLESLDQAISATVAETRLLFSTSVQALCRNGLLIPVVDGFDELIGSRTYGDALAQLRPWLKALGGRGVLVVSARSSYFLSLYKDSIDKETNRDISVYHHEAILDRWEPQQRDQYLEQLGVPCERLAELPPEEAELLRLPFFARASIPYLQAEQSKRVGGLLAGLIHEYADREQKKLQITGSYLLSAEAVESLLAELAAYMIENNTREVSLADLQMVAGTSKAIPGGDLPELQNRVVALCGLDVNDTADRRFRFSHEVFLDFFFGRYVADMATRPADLRRLLSRCKLTVSAARIVWSRATLSDALLESLTNGWDSPLPANVGLLWTCSFSTRRNIGKVNIQRVRFADVDLADVRMDTMSFVDSAFASITLPRAASGSLRFSRCAIDNLQVDGSLKGIVFDNCRIGSAISGSDYSEEPNEIMALLHQRGAEVRSAVPKTSTAKSEMQQMARFFLERIKARAANSIVLGRDNLPEEDQRLGWATNNRSEWLRFVRALEEFGLAYQETFSASGARKSRLRLAPPDQILEARTGDEKVWKFWEALAAGHSG